MVSLALRSSNFQNVGGNCGYATVSSTVLLHALMKCKIEHVAERGLFQSCELLHVAWFEREFPDESVGSQ